MMASFGAPTDGVRNRKHQNQPPGPFEREEMEVIVKWLYRVPARPQRHVDAAQALRALERRG